MKQAEFRKQCEEQRRTTNTRGKKDQATRQWGSHGEAPPGASHNRSSQRAAVDQAADQAGKEARAALSAEQRGKWSALWILAKQVAASGNVERAKELIAEADAIAPLTSKMRKAVAR